MCNTAFDIDFPRDASDHDQVSNLFMKGYVKHHVQMSNNPDVHKAFIHGFMISTILNFVSVYTIIKRWFVWLGDDRAVHFALLEKSHEVVMKVFMVQTDPNNYLSVRIPQSLIDHVLETRLSGTKNHMTKIRQDMATVSYLHIWKIQKLNCSM